jgi:hypothetical protein
MQRIWCRPPDRTDMRTLCPAKRSAIGRNGGHCVQSDRLAVTVESANVARTSRQLIGGHQEDAIPLRIGHDIGAMLAAFGRGRGLSLTHAASLERRLGNHQHGRHLTFQKPMQTNTQLIGTTGPTILVQQKSDPSEGRTLRFSGQGEKKSYVSGRQKEIHTIHLVRPPPPTACGYRAETVSIVQFDTVKKQLQTRTTNRQNDCPRL